MPLPSEDHRRIQTAVIGHKDSDLAVILPMDAAELTRWRQQHPRFTYWCGTLLGGCGEPLTDRLYHSKVCHFAHHPHHTCTRTANGEDSADHLFMKRALHQWMRSQELNGTVQWSKSAISFGEGIDVALQGNHRRLCFRLKPGRRSSWGTEAGQDEEEVDWIFGLGGPAPQEFFDMAGYVFRIRFETQGGQRCPYLGVQRRSGVIDWTPFADAAMTDEGLTTATVREIRAAHRRSAVARGSESTANETSPETTGRSESRISRQLSRDELVVAVRDALELDARWATRTTWKRLGQAIGTDFSQYSVTDLRDLLTEVDDPFPMDDPVLSALIRTDTGEPLPYLDGLLEALGLGRPSSTSHLKRWVQREVDRAFAKYGIPARSMPPALPLSAAVPEIVVDLPCPARQRMSARSRRSRNTDVGHQAPAVLRQLRRLIAQGQELAGSTRGKTGTRLRSEIRSARRWVQGTQHRELNDRSLHLLRETTADLGTAIQAAKNAARHREKTSGESKQKRRSLEVAQPAQQQREASSQPAQPTVVPVPRQDLRQRLIEVAQAGGTINWPLLAGVKNTPAEERRKLLSRIEDRTHSEAPLLSALVVAPGGGPVPYFREILTDMGLAVPRSNEALLRIWLREQERAYAAYANPPRPVPPRLVPRAATVDDAPGDT